MKATPINRNFGLDLLRAIAISLVIISHIALLIFPNQNNLIITFVKTLGAIGVDLFFVLSGFLIGGIILKQIENKKTKFKDLLTFWNRRWLRTLPNFFLILIINCLIYFILLGTLPKSIWKFFLFFQNFKSPHPNFFTEAWSLSIEEYAYLILPFLLFLGFNFFNRIKPKTIYISLVLFSLVTLLLPKFIYLLTVESTTFENWSDTFRKVVIYRIDSIYVGFLVVFIFKKFSNKIRHYRKIVLTIGLAIFASVHLLIYFSNINPVNNLGFFVLGYLGLVIVSLACLFPFFIELKYAGSFKKIIEIISVHSYIIYLVNYSIILLGIQQLFDVSNSSFIQKIILIILFLGTTAIISAIIYKYFEQPILKYRDKVYPRN